MSFDPKSFMDQQYDEGSVSVTPCPEGEWEAVVVPFKDDEPVSFRELTSRKDGSVSHVMEVMLEISDPEVCETTERNPTKVRYQAFLDLTESGNLDMGKGKNVGLNRLRDAVGLNKPGFRFPDLVGKSLIAKVTHRFDPNDETKVFDECRSVRAL